MFAFGLATDFRSVLFPAAQRLFELADEVARIQVEVLCWCGREGLLNARVVDGRVVREGEQVVIGDTVDDAPRCATRCSAAATTAPATSARATEAQNGSPQTRHPVPFSCDHRQLALLAGPAVAGHPHRHRAARPAVAGATIDTSVIS